MHNQLAKMQLVGRGRLADAQGTMHWQSHRRYVEIYDGSISAAAAAVRLSLPLLQQLVYTLFL